MVLKNSNVAHPSIPKPCDYGWNLSDNGIYEAIIYNCSQAPESLIELILCACKSDCSIQRCQCKKSNLVCTDLCKCSGCVNEEGVEDIDDNIDDVFIDDVFIDDSDESDIEDL